MKNTLLLLAFLVFSISNAQKCKFETEDTDGTTGKQITITKPKLITPTNIGATEYMFAKGGKIGQDKFLILDIRADKKFTINSECKIAFNAEGGVVELNFKEFKIAYFNDIGDHSSYWKLKTRIPIDSTFINTLSSSKVTSIKWDTAEESYEKKLKNKHNKNINKLLNCLKDEADASSENEKKPAEEITETPKEDIKNTSAKAPLKKKTEKKEIVEEDNDEKKAYVKSAKELEIEKSIVIPGKKSEDD